MSSDPMSWDEILGNLSQDILLGQEKMKWEKDPLSGYYKIVQLEFFFVFSILFSCKLWPLIFFHSSNLHKQTSRVGVETHLEETRHHLQVFFLFFHSSSFPVIYYWRRQVSCWCGRKNSLEFFEYSFHWPTWLVSAIYIFAIPYKSCIGSAAVIPFFFLSLILVCGEKFY